MSNANTEAARKREQAWHENAALTLGELNELRAIANRRKPLPPHGTYMRYKGTRSWSRSGRDGCRCDLCRRANADEQAKRIVGYLPETHPDGPGTLYKSGAIQRSSRQKQIYAYKQLSANGVDSPATMEVSTDKEEDVAAHHCALCGKRHKDTTTMHFSRFTKKRYCNEIDECLARHERNKRKEENAKQEISGERETA